MCGIVGAIARRNVAKILVEGLSRLEYRGYDSAGVAINNETGKDVLTHLKDVVDEEQGNQKIEKKIKTFVKNTIDTISKKLTTN